jgi:NADPH-dependent ferric siderophore reductase
MDPEATALLLGGDETAIPAISQLLEVVPPSVPVTAYIEVVAAASPPSLPSRSGGRVEWCVLSDGAVPGDALMAAVRRADLPAGGRVWVAGEAAAVQRIRRYLFEERGLPRSHATVRGYWKHGRAGDPDADADADA